MTSISTDTQTRHQLRTFISGFVRTDVFKDQDNLFEAGLVNSMFAMQLILFIEKEFGLTVASDELELRNFSSIDAMCAFITGKHCA
jgi:methoxymalonate biosynthesis acyl carrier protein